MYMDAYTYEYTHQQPYTNELTKHTLAHYKYTHIV